MASVTSVAGLLEGPLKNIRLSLGVQTLSFL